ncbi:MAG: TPR repeat protein [Gammaproteobacteria bacterium]|jgi:TPR repeat protein
MIVNAYGLLAVLLFALSASDFVYRAPAVARSARRNRLLKSVIALPLILSSLGALALGLFLLGMSHGSRPENYQAILFIVACLLPVALLVIWSFGSLWVDALWMLIVAALLGYLVFFNPAIYVRYWAKINITSAQMWMARHYETGQGGLAQSKSNARSWYKSAAQNGNRDAQYRMGSTARRSKTTLKWYLLAAQQDHVGAMVQLARSASSDEERQRWLQAALKEKHPEAIFMLAKQSIKTDLPQARRLLLDAAEHGSRSAIAYLLTQYQQGGLLFDADEAAVQHWSAVLKKTPASPLDPAGLSAVTIEQRINSSPTTPTTSGDAGAADAATLYQRAQSFLHHPAKDQVLHDRAINDLTRAAERGHIEAALELARLATTKASPKSLNSEAINWYELAAINNNQKALQALARHYKGKDDADAADLEKSLKYSERVINILQTDNNKRQRLTLQHWTGEYRDTQKRLAQMARLGGSWKVAEQQAASSAEKQYLLGKELIDGRQYDKGMQHMRSAAQRGSTKARLELAARTLRGPRSFSQEVDAISELQALDQIGVLQASLKLASMYQSNIGLVPRNYYLARQMLRKAQAAPLLSAAAQRGLSRIPSVIADLTIDAEHEPRATIEAWYQRAAAQLPGDEVLREQLAALLDHFAGIDALKQRAASDDGQAQYQLAQTMQSHDLNAAMRWLQRAAKSGFADAQYELAVRMVRGKKNTAEQQQTLQQLAITAADSGHVGAIAFVAAQYKRGAGGFTTNVEMAKHYYRRALESSDAGTLYEGEIAGRVINIRRAAIQKALLALGE